MQTTLSAPLLSCLSDVLAARIGLHFPVERWSDLERGIAAAASAFGMPDAKSCAHWLLSAPLTHSQIEILASHLTVGETYFFRDRKSFEALEQYVLPALIHSRRDSERRLRIWSAGCCTGEEPYSIAMLLDRLVPGHEQWNMTILATDINPRFLRKGVEGVYGEWSFRDAPGWIKERYFKSERQGRYAIHPRIKSMVTFSYLNLADDAYPSLSNNTNAMDIIFCRNVLMYFTAELAEKVAGNLQRSLVDGGWLAVSPAETLSRSFSGFSPVHFHDAMFYRKTMTGGLTDVSSGYPQRQAEPATAYWTPAEPVATPAFPEILAPWPLPEMRGQPEAPPVLAESAIAPPEPLPDKQRASGELLDQARICANQGKLAESVSWCEQAIALDKLDPRSHYLLAAIRQELGQTDAAEQSLKRALYLDPDFVLASFAFGNLRLSQGRYGEAERYFRNVQALLQKRPSIETIPEADGLTAGRLNEIVLSVLDSLPSAAAMRGRKGASHAQRSSH